MFDRDVFIHPFADGNGRMGRMWHSLLLGKWNEIFYWLPIEELIRSRQQEYYDALGKSDRESDSSTQRITSICKTKRQQIKGKRIINVYTVC
ncbi:MAG: Fic family protein [Bilifractor sp.]